MGWREFFGVQKKVLQDSEIEIIKQALEYVSKGGGFQDLYFDTTAHNDFKAHGFKTKEEAIESSMDSVVKMFMKNNGPLGYVILNSGRWYETFKELDAKNQLVLDDKTANNFATKKAILNALGGLDTLRIRLQAKEYIIMQNGRLCYPAAICRETPEGTKERFIELITPLLKLR